MIHPTMFHPAHLEATTHAMYALGRALEHHPKLSLLRELGMHHMMRMVGEMRAGAAHALCPRLAAQYERDLARLYEIQAERQALAGL